MLDRALGLVAALRRAGVPVSVAESVDAGRALAVVGLGDREALRAALATTLVKRAGHERTFHHLFDLWFPAVVGDPAVPPTSGEGDGDGEPDVDAWRDRLTEVLLAGDSTAIEGFARAAVTAFGRAESAPGRQSYFAYRVDRALSPQTLVARLLDALLAGEQRGGLAEAVARATVRERLRAFGQTVDAEIRRRLAEDRGAEAVANATLPPLAESVDFLRLSRDDLAELRRQVHPLARRLASRLAVRRHHARRGRLDVRRTMRTAVGTGGVPITTHHRPPRPHKPELVVLCDVSGSVAAFAHFTLLLTWALAEQFTRVRAFAFVDTTDEVTRFLERPARTGEDVAAALDRMNREARVVWFDGHSDYGHALEVFAEQWPDAVTPRTSLLVLGDARTNYRDPALPVLRRLAGQARHAYWLNPEPRGRWGSGDSAADAYGRVVEMVECRTVAQLEQFVHRLLPVG